MAPVAVAAGVVTCPVAAVQLADPVARGRRLLRRVWLWCGGRLCNAFSECPRDHDGTRATGERGPTGVLKMDGEALHQGNLCSKCSRTSMVSLRWN